jgi:glycosyltransferase involved in cell wall biosynthesis
MRVVIAKKLLSTVGGSELQARSLGRALAARGHDVTLVGMRPAWPRPGIPAAALAGTRGAITQQEDGMRSVFLPVRLGRAGAAIDGLLPTTLVHDGDVEGALSGADVVHVIAREWAGAFERAARRAGAAFVETPLVHPGQPFSGDSAASLDRYRRASAVIALTEWEAEWYRARGVTRVHVTGVGPVIDGLPAVAPDPATVLYVGRKERYKGYHALREAAPIVWRERPDALFVAIGQRSWRDGLGRAPRDARWIERGVVDERAKAEAYARATVLAMPSDHETFGHTYLEAWAARRPVIAGDIPPLREVVREGIDGVHARNEPRAVARAILRILADPGAATRMGEAGYARLQERFTWELVAARTERVYEDARRSSR